MWGFKNELESKMFLAFKIIFGFLLPLSVIGFSYVNILKAIRNKKLDSAGFKRNYYSKISIVYWLFSGIRKNWYWPIFNILRWLILYTSLKINNKRGLKIRNEFFSWLPKLIPYFQAPKNRPHYALRIQISEVQILNK